MTYNTKRGTIVFTNMTIPCMLYVISSKLDCAVPDSIINDLIDMFNKRECVKIKELRILLSNVYRVSKCIESSANSRYIDTVSHYCLLEKSKGITDFDIFLNDKNVMDIQEKTIEPQPKIVNIVSIGKINYYL